MDDDLTHYMKRVSEKSQECDSLRSQLDKEVKRIGRLMNDVADRDRTIQSLRKHITAVSGTVTEHRKEIKELRKELKK